jgi:hypothetical protein
MSLRDHKKGRRRLTENETDDSEACVVDGSSGRDIRGAVKHDDEVDVPHPRRRILQNGECGL